MISGNFLIGCLVTVNDNRLQSFYVEILIRFCSISWIFGKFPKFPYRGSKFSKVGNDCGNLSLPSGNLLVSDLRRLVKSENCTEMENCDKRDTRLVWSENVDISFWQGFFSRVIEWKQLSSKSPRAIHDAQTTKRTRIRRDSQGQPTVVTLRQDFAQVRTFSIL